MLRCLLVLLLLSAGSLSPAQNLETPDYKVTIDVELVQLPVSVVDKHGLPVRGLHRQYFTVYEDKVLQDISVFTQDEVPLSVGLVIDTSGSMIKKVDRLSTAAMTFIRENNPEDQTSIVTFGEDVSIERNFTGDTHELTRALMRIPPNRGTALYDAIFLAAKDLVHTGSHEKKALLIVTDGEDNKSRYDLKQVRQALSESKVIVYTVGLLSSDSPDYIQDESRKVLNQLAKDTGGASFFPKNVNDVDEVCKRIARDLRNQYTIGYRPTNRNLDGSWRKIQVRINPPKDTPSLKIRTKQGYYAPNRQRAALEAEPHK
jgi:Ca-activated chloride channel homolog